METLIKDIRYGVRSQSAIGNRKSAMPLFVAERLEKGCNQLSKNRT